MHRERCWEKPFVGVYLGEVLLNFCTELRTGDPLQQGGTTHNTHLYHGHIPSSEQQELILSSQLPHTAPPDTPHSTPGHPTQHPWEGMGSSSEEGVKWHWHFEEEAQGTHTSRETKPSRTAIFKASSCNAVNVTDKSALLCANTLQSKCNLGDHEFIPTKEHFTVQTCSARFCPEGEEKKGKMQRGKKIFTPF